MTPRTVLGAAVLAAAVLALAACNPQLLPPARAIGGVLILDQRDPIERGGGDCRGTGGYADLRSGVEVTVSDAGGRVLGRDPLLARPAPTDAAGNVPEAERRRCVWEFGFRDLPDQPSYRIAIGGRGAVEYSREELEAEGWTVQVSLGD
jgi:hypothetical protein